MKTTNKNVCVKCKALCCKLGGPTATSEERDKILKAGFKDHFIKSGNFYDTETKTGICPHLKKYLCTIYKVRPLVCKTHPMYPVWNSKKKRYIILDCPLTKHLTKIDINKLKRMAAKITTELMVTTLSDFDPATERRWKRFHWDQKARESFNKDGAEL